MLPHASADVDITSSHPAIFSGKFQRGSVSDLRQQPAVWPQFMYMVLHQQQFCYISAADFLRSAVSDQDRCEELVRRAFEERDLEKVKLIVAELHRILDDRAQRIRSTWLRKRSGRKQSGPRWNK
jgi:hypothetical protein